MAATQKNQFFDPGFLLTPSDTFSPGRTVLPQYKTSQTTTDRRQIVPKARPIVRSAKKELHGIPVSDKNALMKQQAVLVFTRDISIAEGQQKCNEKYITWDDLGCCGSLKQCHHSIEYTRMHTRTHARTSHATHIHTHTQLVYGSQDFVLEQPRSAGTRRNIHPLTPITVFLPSFLQSSAVEQVLGIPLLYLHIVLSAAVCLSVT